MQTIGDRIKQKRKELHLTQLELAEKLNVTDRAVSKWEQNDGNPDFSLLTKLSEVLNVSLDYLVAGKEPEVNLDDMDATKRALYLAKNDDLDNFIKYECFDETLFFDMESRKRLAPRSSNAAHLENLRKTIIENRSLKIFSLMLDAFVKYCYEHRNDRIMRSVFSGAYFVKGYLDDFVSMTCELGRIDVLKLIKVEWFNSYIAENISPYICSNSNDTQFKLFNLKDETIKYILSNPKIPVEIVDYFCTPAFLYQLKRDESFGRFLIIPVVGNLVNSVLLCLYEIKDKAHIKKVMDCLYNNLRTETKPYLDYDTSWDSRNGYRDVIKDYSYGVCFSRKTDGSTRRYTYYAAVPLINSALDKAKSDLNLEMVVLFNDYNKAVEKTLCAKPWFMTDEDIRLFSIKCDPKSSETDKILASYSKYGILDYRSLFSSTYKENPICDDVSSLKKNIVLLKTIYEKYVKDSSICFMELIQKNIKNKDYKTLFKFATDYKLSTLEEPILSLNDDEILTRAKEIFASTPHIDTNEDNSLTSTVVEPLSDMLEWQNMVFPHGYSDDIDYIKYCEKLKKDYLTSEVNQIEQLIESITLEQKHKTDYDKISKDITFEYLRSELAKGNIDTVVIKLCVLLEATLIYKYKYTGDLFSMVDKFVNSHLTIRELHNCFDDEDNLYNSYQKEDEEIREENAKNAANIEVLHKLRMRRNNLVHAESTPVSMSVAELEKCISIVESM